MTVAGRFDPHGDTSCGDVPIGRFGTEDTQRAAHFAARGGHLPSEKQPRRMERMAQFADCAPPDWGSGYDHITVGCPAKDQAMADLGLPLFTELPIRQKTSFYTRSSNWLTQGVSAVFRQCGTHFKRPILSRCESWRRR